MWKKEATCQDNFLQKVAAWILEPLEAVAGELSIA